ncbi:RhoGAP domain containing protein [Tritrichomonas foetus]|uniref:RhoGAP domain containing protein n=1 Tax=Tritrichomonas foetus TaxID=1144522 RepID=A0A1J4K3L2_9EUKA|nr:RhoGAP domain containing protein [Tritrichomonas foetus]|eukprot:OHT06033.1 RhoGAP domain containing protein [Tritrichomonas foetus]
MLENSVNNTEIHHFFEMPPEAFHGKIPFIVTDLIAELKNRNWADVEGIFRLNGSDTKTKELCDDLDKDRVTNWAKYDDVHTIATALKRYFRQMSEHEPLVTLDVYDCVIGLMGINDEEREVDVFKNVLAMLPKIRMITLGYLCQFLNETAKSSSKNKMTPDNLAICFAPNIITSPNVPPLDAMQQAQLANKALALLISRFNDIFTDFSVDESLFCNEEDFSLFNAPPINVVHIQHQIFRCNFRHGHIIPFVPLCRLVKTKRFERPTRDPPDPANIEGDETLRQQQVLTTLLNSKMIKPGNSVSPKTEKEVSSFSLD